MNKRVSKNIESAQEILGGQRVEPTEMLKLAKRLKGENAFGYARKILALARKAQIPDPFLRITMRQQHALCTYKDADLPVADRLDRALEILGEGEEDLQETRNQETLGIAGAIHKRKWEVYGQKHHLERSLAYYLRGYEEGVKYDYGYTSINAAYVLDVLAALDATVGGESEIVSEMARARQEQAREIRREITATLPELANDPNSNWLKTEWWFLVTLAEAYFGLQEYNQALKWLNEAKKLKVADWEYETTARQLASLARLHAQAEGSASGLDLEDSAGWNVLREFYKPYAKAVASIFVGKVGLALTGEGFRASLFQIGVLAKLAEMDVLRSVEVLSCVSGGSVVGTLFYLEVRHLLQKKVDAEVTREDYIEIVQRIEKSFLPAVRRNIHVRAATEMLTPIKKIFLPDYSDARRAGDIYEKEIFSTVGSGQEKVPSRMADLQIQPVGETEDFLPKYHNWRRVAKVPVLILNATTLNTGHTWQFTSSWMGEPPSGIDPEMDGSCRLQRMYYWQAPKRYADLKVGDAVAASACVPGRLTPLTLSNLYPDLTVRLVAGSVHDNQGVLGLLDEDCKVILVSDAGAQTNTQIDPGNHLPEVSRRSTDILIERFSGEQYRRLDERLRSSLLRGLMFVHLKKGLSEKPLSRVNAEEAVDISDDERPLNRLGPLTRYGIRKDVQERLVSTPTDNDSFSSAVAYALMTSGYLMTQHELAGCPELFKRAKEEERASWRFLVMEEPMKRVENSEVMKLLKPSGWSFGLWRLRPWLKIVLLFGVLLIALFLILIMSGDIQPFSTNTTGIRLEIHLYDYVLLAIGALIVGWCFYYFSYQPMAQGKPAKNIGQLIDRSDLVETLSKVFEAAGYEVERLPRLRGNALQVNIDLLARKRIKDNGRLEKNICVEVKTADKASQSLWRAVSELEIAGWTLRDQRNISPDNIETWLVLVDMEQDERWKNFAEEKQVETDEGSEKSVEQRRIRVLFCSSRELSRVLERADPREREKAAEQLLNAPKKEMA